MQVLHIPLRKFWRVSLRRLLTLALVLSFLIAVFAACNSSGSLDKYDIVYSATGYATPQRNGLYLVNESGSQRKLIIQNFLPNHLKPSPDGKKFLSLNDSGIILIDVNDAIQSDQPNELVVLPYGQLGGIINLSWSPSGDKILFSTYGPEHNIYTVGEDGLGFIQLTDDDSSLAPEWSPDGEQIVYSSTGGIYTMNSDGTNKQKVTDIESSRSPAWSPDGDRIAFIRDGSDYQVDLIVINSDGGNLIQFEIPGLWGCFAWSPDGNKIAFDAFDPVEGEPQLFVVNSDGNELRQITKTYDHPSCPSWSSNSEKLLFRTIIDGRNGVSVIDVDGSNRVAVSQDLKNGGSLNAIGGVWIR